MPDDPTRNPFARLHLGLVSTVYNAGGAILADIARAGRLDPLRDLRGIHLAGIDLSGWDLRSVDLGNVDLRGTRLRHATIDCTTLIGPMSDIDAEDVEAVHAALDRPLELRALKPGTIICDAPGAPQLAFVPKGEFVMGMPNGEGKAEGLNDDWGEWSRPLTPVTFERGFWIGRFPVTVGEFRLFAMDSGRKAGSKWDKVGFQAENRDDHPVVEVS